MYSAKGSLFASPGITGIAPTLTASPKRRKNNDEVWMESSPCSEGGTNTNVERERRAERLEKDPQSDHSDLQ